MTDIPGKEPGEWGKRQYQIEIYTPNLHREGERWRTFGEPYDDLAKVEYAIDDLVRSMKQLIDDDAVTVWRKSRLRVRELVIEAKFGKVIALP
jgi:hypothetical protein